MQLLLLKMGRLQGVANPIRSSKPTAQLATIVEARLVKLSSRRHGVVHLYVEVFRLTFVCCKALSNFIASYHSRVRLNTRE
jgi:hypothetical protein